MLLLRPGHSSSSRPPGPWSPLLLPFLVLAVLAISAREANGQVAIGAHGVSAADAFGGSRGLGARLAFGLPIFPLELLGTVEHFFPDCEDRDCSLQGISLDASLDLLPLPLVRPYVTGGYTVRRVDTGLGEGSVDRRGVNLGAGLKVTFPGFRVFGEGRYELVRAPERQTLVRIGVLFGG